jgi:hypothetical protein
VPADRAALRAARVREEHHMDRSDIGHSAGPSGAGRQAGGAEPTGEQRAAAAAVLQMIWGVHISRAVYVAAELGVADLLAGGPLTAAQLAQARGVDERSLYRVLRLLAALGVLTEQDGRVFGLTELGERLRAGVPASVRSWALVCESLETALGFAPLTEAVTTGQPAFGLAHGMNLFEFMAGHRELAQRFQPAMSERTAAFAPSVAAGYDFSPVRTVADIGGGKGTLLAAILRAHTHLRGILFDLPAALPDAAAVLRQAGVDDRCQIVPGDFFQAIPQGADCYLLANVLHDWDDPTSAQILNTCRQAMANDGRVLIVERLIPGQPAAAVPVLLSDLHMMVFTGGQERTNAQYGQLLAQAGLNLTSVQPVAPPYGVIEGLAPSQ